MSRAKNGIDRPAGFGLTVRTSSGREFEVELDYDDDRAMVAGLLETVEYVDATFVGYDVAPAPKARAPKEPTAKPATRAKPAKRTGGGGRSKAGPTCGECGGIGHNIRTCPERDPAGVAAVPAKTRLEQIAARAKGGAE
jgi:hypothetical protein